MRSFIKVHQSDQKLLKKICKNPPPPDNPEWTNVPMNNILLCGRRRDIPVAFLHVLVIRRVVAWLCPTIKKQKLLINKVCKSQ